MTGQLTCTNPHHQSLEAHHKEKGQSWFQLRDCLQRTCDLYPTGHSTNSRTLSQLAAVDNNAEDFEIDSTGRVTDAHSDAPLPDTTQKRLCAKFTHSRTHNKQLVVVLCGMILGCNTMFGAEGVASVAVSQCSHEAI